MSVYQLDPMRDPRWGDFLQRHPSASVFHAAGWLEALCRTYGYEPVVLTTSPPGAELTNGLAFCRINSWLTGRRLVSLPFSDHCEPLVDSLEDFDNLLYSLKNDLDRENWKYVEVRPLRVDMGTRLSFEKAKFFYFHKLDLGPSSDELLRNFHKDSIQRKIRRAERERLTYEDGRSDSLLDKFYRLLLQTRRRQLLPPHPRAWFRNLMDCLGDKLKIRVASKDGRPVASILTLSYKDSLVYKYGCSDARFNNLGGMPFLFWRAIQEAKKNGLLEFDMGRSDCDNAGLITFKDRWGTARSTLTYWRYPVHLSSSTTEGWRMQIAQHIFARMPDELLTTAGKLFYKHVG